MGDFWVTPEEKAAGELAPGKLAAIVRKYEEDGLCVLCNVIEHEVLDSLVHRYDFDAAHRYVNGDQFKQNQKGPALNPDYDGNLHLQLNLPRCHPYVHPEIVANPIIEQVAGAVLHGLVYIRYINGNTACPGATYQHLHVDTQGDWGMKLAVNFSVDDITPENGSTEVWPKTHRDTIKPEESLQEEGAHKELVDKMRKTTGSGPTQLTVPKGAICLRDLRVWHRAMPNCTQFPRHMYYLSYSADGEHNHASPEPEPGMPSAPLIPEPDGLRAAVLPTRDPLANSSQLGAGKVNLQFSEDTRWAFTRTPEQAARSKVDWNVCFSPERCDQYGNTPTTVPEELLAKAQGINAEKMRAQNREKQTIPAGLDRFTYWFPEEKLADDPRLPWWIRELAQGRTLQRPPSLLSTPPWERNQFHGESTDYETGDTTSKL